MYTVTVALVSTARAGELANLHRNIPVERALDHVAGFIETPRFYTALSGRRNLELLAALDLRDEPTAKIDEVLEIVDLAGRDRDKVRTSPTACASASASLPRCCATRDFW